MSLEFNRRSFLKYSAAAAVAVAGSSLLTGCGEDEYQKTGKIGSTLKLMGAFELESAKLTTDPSTATTGKYPDLQIQSERHLQAWSAYRSCKLPGRGHSQR